MPVGWLFRSIARKLGFIVCFPLNLIGNVCIERTFDLYFAEPAVLEGFSPVVATVRRRDWRPYLTGINVTVTSSDTTEASVPMFVNIPAWKAETTFLISAVSDGIDDGDQTVTIFVSADSWTADSRDLIVRDRDPP